MDQYSITQEFKGYRTKTDKTKLPDGYLVDGSQNVLSTDGDNIKIRSGYTLDGAANSSLNPIESSYDWITHNGTELNLRSYDDELEFRYVDSSGNVTWTRIADGWSAVDFNYAEYWDTDEVEDILFFVNGDDNIYSWSGAYATVDITNSTSNTLVKQGTTTWGEERFIADGTNYDKKLKINGTEYTYTGGEGTTTLTGVSPDPTAGGHSDGDLAVQSVSTTANKPGSNVKNDLIAVLDNQVWVGSLTNRQVYVSAVNDFTDYTFSSPRLVGEGVLLTLDASPTAFVVQEDSMYISAGKDQWYFSTFELSSDLQKESIFVKRLKSDSQGAAQSQGMVARIKNNVMFVSNEPTIDVLGRVEDVETPQSIPVSDPIKPTLEGYTFTGADSIYHRNNYYLALPEENRLLIYNFERSFWEAPQVLPAGKLAIIGGELYLHSNSVPETYKLFTGTNDNDTSINAIAKFSYHNYGDRVNLKNFDEWYTEGYIRQNTKLTLKLYYEYRGAETIKSYTIDGNDEDIIFKNTEDASLGKISLGKNPLGNTGSSDESDTLNKFRQINQIVKSDFYEVQVSYESNSIDYQWELLGFGGNVKPSTSKPISIKK